MGRSRSRARAPALFLLGLLAFQALFIARARVASAAQCTYNPATDTINVTIASEESVALVVEGDGADLDPDAAEGAILYSEGGEHLQCGSASTTNTVSIVVLGTPDSSESLTIDDLAGAAFPATISWSIDLGSGFDTFRIEGAETNDTIVLNDGGFVLNGGPGALIGVEDRQAFGNDGNDSIDASAVKTGTALFGMGGEDLLIGGVTSDSLSGGDGGDVLDGGPGGDRLFGGLGIDTCLLEDGSSIVCDPSLEVTPDPVASDGQLTVQGSGWYPENGAVALSFEPAEGAPSPPAPLPDPATGVIQAQVAGPTVEGNYAVVACQLCLDPATEQVDAQFTVETSSVPPAGPSVAVLPNVVPVGEPATVTGAGWDSAQGPISLFMDSSYPGGEPFANVPVVGGGFEQELPVLELSEGEHVVSACQRCGEPDVIDDSARFTIEEAPPDIATLRVDPMEAKAGDQIHVIGEGWDPDGGGVSVLLDPSATPSDPDRVATPNAEGGFEVALDVPDLEPGPYTVQGCQRCDEDGEVRQTAVLTVLETAGAAPWRRWIVPGAAVLLAVVAGLVIYRLLHPRPKPIPTGRPDARLHIDEPEVTVETQPGGPPRHRLSFVFHEDPGVQRLEERRP